MYGGTNRKTGGKAGGSKTKVHFQFFVTRKDRDKIQMIWTCAKEDKGVQCSKDVEYETDRLERKRKATEKIHGCCEGGHAEGWCDRRGSKGEMEADYLVWEQLKEEEVWYKTAITNRHVNHNSRLIK